MASKDVVALANRIEREFGLQLDPEKFFRTYAGKHQLAAGECTWVMYGKGDYPIVVGGFEPVRKYVTKRNQLSISECRFRGYELYVTCPGEFGYKEKDCVTKENNDGKFQNNIH